MKNLLKQKYLIILILILAAFFRLWHFADYFSFGHDEDLAAWIVKDIFYDHHLRLIGQETSIGGVFVGPLFYYLLVPFFGLFNGNPLAGLIPLIVIALATTFSIYFVFTKFFNKSTGLLAAFIYAISMDLVFGDRWLVPTQTVFLYTIWYFYLIFSIYNGKLKLPLIGLMIGLIWHVHVIFIPLLLLIPLIIFLSPKKQDLKLHFLNPKILLLSLFIFFVLITPFILFETRHGFQQIHGLFSVTSEHGQVGGLERLEKIYQTASMSLLAILFFYNNELILIPNWLLLLSPVIFLGLGLWLWKKKILSRDYGLILGSWIFLDVLAQTISKRGLNGYYFNNLTILFLLFIGLMFNFLKSKFGSVVILPFVICFLSLNFYWLFTAPIFSDGYIQRTELIDQIKVDVQKNQYPCIAINYIGDPGVGGGYRYLFWWKNIPRITPGNDVPVYSIVFPYTISGDEINQRFGNLGLILPKPKMFDPKVCSDPSRQLLPLSGFNN